MHNRPVEIDVRAIASVERNARIFSTLADLQGGDAMILTLDHDPHPLLYQLQVEKPGDFNWSPLEEGPQVWRVRIDRRASTHKRHRAINEYLAWDHDRLDELLEKTLAEARAGRWSDVEHDYADFRHGLERHIVMEEEYLFPAFEERSGMGKNEGPTVVMREEHQEIRELLVELGRIAGRASGGQAPETPAPFEHATRALLNVLVEHNLKEEQVLYPSLDHMLTEDERDALVRRLMAVRT